MAGRSAMDLSTRIGRLQAAEVRAKALPFNAVLGARQMADLISVHWNQLRDWCDKVPALEKGGAFRRGGAAVAWEFNPHVTTSILLEHFREVQSRQSGINKRAQKASGADDVDEDFGTAELVKFLELRRGVKREKIEDGNLCKLDDVVWFFDGIAERVKSRFMSILTETDPNGKLDHKLRGRIDSSCRNALLNFYEDCQELRELFDAGEKSR